MPPSQLNIAIACWRLWDCNMLSKLTIAILDVVSISVGMRIINEFDILLIIVMAIINSVIVNLGSCIVGSLIYSYLSV